jgi:hypothetical protein
MGFHVKLWITRILMTGFLAGSFHADEVLGKLDTLFLFGPEKIAAMNNHAADHQNDTSDNTADAPAKAQVKPHLSHFSGLEIMHHEFAPILWMVTITMKQTRFDFSADSCCSVWQPPKA